VLRSPVGETRETTRSPLDQEELKSRLGALRETLVRARGARDVIIHVEPTGRSAQQDARELGRSLFDLLFAGEVGSLYVESLREARRAADRGLRVKLRTHAPELALLPWEFLYDQRRGDFVCLSNATPLVRYLETPNPPQVLAVTTPLRILGMVASPPGLPPLDVDGEKARVEEAIAEPRRRGLVDITWLPGESWEALTQAVGRGGGGPWHVFHFIGHGGFDPRSDEGHLALVADDGGTYELSAIGLSRLLGDHPTLRLVVLNACEGAKGSGDDLVSSTAATLVRRGLPAVVSMQFEISDRAAIEFAREFYRTLALGNPVDAAVAEARKAVSFALPQSMEWATPVLHMRAPDGNLFALAGQDPRPASVPATQVTASQQPVPDVRGHPQAGRTTPRQWARRPVAAAAGAATLAALTWGMLSRDVTTDQERPAAEPVKVADSALFAHDTHGTQTVVPTPMAESLHSIPLAPTVTGVWTFAMFSKAGGQHKGSVRLTQQADRVVGRMDLADGTAITGTYDGTILELFRWVPSLQVHQRYKLNRVNDRFEGKFWNHGLPTDEGVIVLSR
jgi:hypothetical protein